MLSGARAPAQQLSARAACCGSRVLQRALPRALSVVASAPMASFHEFKAKDINGKEVECVCPRRRDVAPACNRKRRDAAALTFLPRLPSFATLKGKVVLAVNVASACG